MNISYDKEADALYVRLSGVDPDGVIEIQDGINVDVTDTNKIVGIEILSASHRLDLKTLFSYTLDADTIHSLA